MAMRRSQCCLYKMPKNMGVAPRFDIWNEKYEPWQAMKRMSRLVGTGFYIPPEWYNHFRMFPPINNNFQQEKTLNPHNESEPTQDTMDNHFSAERIALRDELSRKSRLVASEGMRYYNIFWIRKPLDRMEKDYYDMKSKGVAHDVAIKKVLQQFYDELTIKKRVSAIQAEEAKLSGHFITMREAVAVMGVLAQLQRDQPSPHQISEMSLEHGKLAQDGTNIRATVKSSVDAMSHTSTEDDVSGSSLSADDLATLLTSDDEVEGEAKYTVEVNESTVDSVHQLVEQATDDTGDVNWYTGASASVAERSGNESS